MLNIEAFKFVVSAAFPSKPFTDILWKITDALLSYRLFTAFLGDLGLGATIS